MSRRNRTLSPPQFRGVLHQLGLDIENAATVFCVEQRAIRRWMSDGEDGRRVPLYVVVQCRLIMDGKLKLRDIIRLRREGEPAPKRIRRKAA